jgi:Family of unknown function (DUF5989)
MHDDPESDIERLARAKRIGLARELYDFLVENRKWWLAPIVIAVLLLGLLVLLGGSAAAPFIYPLF